MGQRSDLGAIGVAQAVHPVVPIRVHQQWVVGDPPTERCGEVEHLPEAGPGAVRVALDVGDRQQAVEPAAPVDCVDEEPRLIGAWVVGQKEVVGTDDQACGSGPG
jgi:hypothetical protein